MFRSFKDLKKKKDSAETEGTACFCGLETAKEDFESCGDERMV